MRALTQIILMYTAPDGTVYERPLTDLPEAGTLIDPETGDDLELTGWRPAADDDCGHNNERLRDDRLVECIDCKKVFRPGEHLFTVTVSGCTAEQAHTVMNERISPDEDYGFDYEIGYKAVSTS